MPIFTRASLDALDRRYRTQLINSLTGFKSVALVGTISNRGVENLAILSQIIHVGANPPLIGMLFRPHTVARHTLENIQATRIFTINHIRPEFVRSAHHTAARWEASEFAACDLAAEYLDEFRAPYVAASHVKIGLHYTEEHTLSNETVLLTGEIQRIHVPDDCVQDDGFVDLEQAQSITCSGLDSYHTTQKLVRLSYAKPNEPLEDIG